MLCGDAAWHKRRAPRPWGPLCPAFGAVLAIAFGTCVQLCLTQDYRRSRVACGNVEAFGSCGAPGQCPDFGFCPAGSVVASRTYINRRLSSHDRSGVLTAQRTPPVRNGTRQGHDASAMQSVDLACHSATQICVAAVLHFSVRPVRHRCVQFGPLKRLSPILCMYLDCWWGLLLVAGREGSDGRWSLHVVVACFTSQYCMHQMHLL